MVVRWLGSEGGSLVGGESDRGSGGEGREVEDQGCRTRSASGGLGEDGSGGVGVS